MFLFGDFNHEGNFPTQDANMFLYYSWVSHIFSNWCHQSLRFDFQRHTSVWLCEVRIRMSQVSMRHQIAIPFWTCHTLKRNRLDTLELYIFLKKCTVFELDMFSQIYIRQCCIMLHVYPECPTQDPLYLSNAFSAEKRQSCICFGHATFKYAPKKFEKKNTISVQTTKSKIKHVLMTSMMHTFFQTVFDPKISFFFGVNPWHQWQCSLGVL